MEIVLLIERKFFWLHKTLTAICALTKGSPDEAHRLTIKTKTAAISKRPDFGAKIIAGQFRVNA